MKKISIFLLCLLLISCSASISSLSTVSISRVNEIESGGVTSLSSLIEYTLFASVPRSTSSSSSGAFEFIGGSSRSLDGAIGLSATADDGILSCSVMAVGDPCDAITATARAIGDESHDFSVGDVWDDVYYLYGSRTMTTSLRCISVTDNLIVMVDTSVSASTSSMNEIASFFEEQLENFTSIFGTHLDVDGNGHVILAFVPLGTSTLGYTTSGDLLDRESYSSSNEADIIYLSSDTLSDTTAFEETKVSVMHEYQHLVSFSNTVRKGSTSWMETWMNEGFSMMAEYYTGESIAGERAAAFVKYALVSYGSHPLLEFNNTAYDYGNAVLFFHYLRDRFGDGLFQTIYDSDSSGTAAIENLFGESFGTIYRDFALSLILTGRGVSDDPRYEIETFNLSSSDPRYVAVGFNMEDCLDSLLETYTERYGTTFNSVQMEMKPYSFVIVPWNGRIDTAIYANSGERILCYALTQ